MASLTRLVPALAAGSLLVLAGCGGGGSKKSSSNNTTTNPTPNTEEREAVQNSSVGGSGNDTATTSSTAAFFETGLNSNKNTLDTARGPLPPGLLASLAMALPHRQPTAQAAAPIPINKSVTYGTFEDTTPKIKGDVTVGGSVNITPAATPASTWNFDGSVAVRFANDFGVQDLQSHVQGIWENGVGPDITAVGSFTEQPTRYDGTADIGYSLSNLHITVKKGTTTITTITCNADLDSRVTYVDADGNGTQPGVATLQSVKGWWKANWSVTMYGITRNYEVKHTVDYNIQGVGTIKVEVTVNGTTRTWNFTSLAQYRSTFNVE